MAWRSSGTTNDEMVDNLKRFGVISSPVVEQGFRNVDRRFFVPQNQQEIAHLDRPLKEANIHISAPHIYGSALEALELTPNSSRSFLNVGSGTGYLSCIVADILGPTSNNFGVEIHSDVVQHCKQAVEQWKESRAGTKTAHIEIIHGNALDINAARGECLVGFDRIYVGASVQKTHVPKLTSLLRPGGILVGPVDEKLVKIVRISSNDSTSNDGGFSQQVLSGVRFASLLRHPSIPVVIPSRVWEPAFHHFYPESFKKSSKELLLCSNAHRKKGSVNLAATLPRVVWLEILSFTHRDWFEPPQSEEAFLKSRLLEEQANAQRANQARLEAEARCHIAERERDVYRLLARRWQSRLQAVLNNREEQDTAGLLGNRETAVIFGLGETLRSFEDTDELLPNNMEEDVDVAAMMMDEGNESEDISVEDSSVASELVDDSNATMDETDVIMDPKGLSTQTRAVPVAEQGGL